MPTATSEPGSRPSCSREEHSLGPVPAAQGSRPRAVGVRHRDLPQLPAALQVRARPADPDRADGPSALRDRRPPGARALSRRTGEHARADARAARRRLAQKRARRRRVRARAAREGAGGADPLPRAAREEDCEPVWFERPFSFRLGPHHLRGRVDRVDRLRGRRGRAIRADRLQDLAAEDRRAAPGRRSALAVRAGRARSLAAGVLAPGLLLRARRRQACRVPRSGARRRGASRTSCCEVGEGILAQAFEPTPSRAACSICDYRIVCPAAERLSALTALGAALAQEALEFAGEVVARGHLAVGGLAPRCRRPARGARRTPGCRGRSAPPGRPGARSRRSPTRARRRRPRPRSGLPPGAAARARPSGWWPRRRNAAPPPTGSPRAARPRRRRRAARRRSPSGPHTWSRADARGAPAAPRPRHGRSWRPGGCGARRRAAPRA